MFCCNIRRIHSLSNSYCFHTTNFQRKYPIEIDESLTFFPFFQQLKEYARTAELPEEVKNHLKKLDIDPSKLDNIPLSILTYDNPITKLDHPLLQKYPPITPYDQEPTQIIDMFKISSLVKRQLELEKKAMDRQMTDYKHLLESVASLGRATEISPILGVTIQWHNDLQRIIEIRIGRMVKEFEEKKTTTPKEEDRISFFTAVSSNKLAVIVTHELLGANFERNKLLVNNVATIIGEVVRAEANYDRLSEEEKRRYHSYHGKEKSIRKINTFSSVLLGEKADWPKSIKVELGMTLLDLLCKVATYEHKTFKGREKESNIIKPFYIEEILGKKYIICVDSFLDYLTNRLILPESHIRHFPMVIPPKPWLSPDSGGYYTSRYHIMRFLNYEIQVAPLYQRSEEMSQIYRGLNALGNTAWRVNKKIMDISKTIWELGGGMIEIPPRFDMPFPEPGPEGKTPQWFRAMKRTRKLNNENHSLRMAHVLKMDVLNEMRDEDRFYFPHSMDFRGRVYPIPPHLNHMGSDFGRGMLEFANGQPLGKSGFKWLQIHLANLSGMDKASYEERIKYIQEHVLDFIECTDRPLSGTRSWMDKDDPWQYLAACIEFTTAIRSGNPENYISHIPVHQDGTCNGLQHYAALGGDIEGARSVNLLPSDRPQDVYTEVVKLIESRIEKDRAENHPMAILLEGKLQRKVVKQTIMTSVYGVTFIGARKQIEAALKDRFPDFPDDKLFPATLYIARKTFDALQDLFKGARAIMEWLVTSSNLVCKGGINLTWITPLGLPVVQPYRKTSRFDAVNTLLQEVVLKDIGKLPANPRRNATAFPPNYVHSLDSSHMFMTALECEKIGITYASVHDSFWTHAGTVDQMNKILREQFVDLYKRPLLQELRNYWLSQNPKLKLPPIPPYQGLDLDQVKHSLYFFH